MKKIIFFASLLLCALPGISGAGDNLEKGFITPPISAQPWVYWFWLNGNITREGITADLEAMHRVGIGGVLIMEVDQGAPRGLISFGSPSWREMFKFMLSEANRLGMQVNMCNDAGWCGSGGPWITPELSMQKLVWTEQTVQGPSHFDGILAQPEKLANYYQDIALFAFPTPAEYRIDHIQAKADFIPERVPPPMMWPALPSDQTVAKNKIVELTPHMNSDGHLSWDVPPGKWTLLRLGHTSTGVENHPAPPGGLGLESDKLSKIASDAMFNGLVAKVITDSKALVPSTLVSTHIDSWETGSQNWTPDFRQDFQKRRGYDPFLYLPIITGRVIDNLETSERFLWDVRRTISDLALDNYAGRIRELAQHNGMRLSIEAYDGTPCDDMAYAGRADEPMAEFWSWGANLSFTCIEMASAAHVYGKRILGAEAFTATDGEKWQHHPATIKALGDWAFCQGINRFVFHRYALQPWLDHPPGMSMGPWGLHYERTETWWDDSSAWHQYLARCQFLLQQGLFAADVCYLEREDSPQRFEPPDGLSPGSMPDRPQYNYDGCTPEVVLTRMKVENGRLVLPDGMSYRVMVLPDTIAMTPLLLRKIKDLVADGATVLGAPPIKSPSLADYPQCDNQVRQLAHELWGDSNGQTSSEHRFGKGTIIRGKKAAEVLTAMGVPPDFTSDEPVRYIHRILKGADIYFVANKTDQSFDALCTFRVQGEQPELWSPETGQIEQAALYNSTGEGMRVPIHFTPSGSVFVVFRHNLKSTDPIVGVTYDGKMILSADKSSEKTKPVIVIQKALYGVLNDPARTRDMRAHLQQLVDRGEWNFPVAHMAEGDDPALGIVKTFNVEFTVDGDLRKVSGDDTGSIDITSIKESPQVAAMETGTHGRLWLDAGQPGSYALTRASGRTTHVNVSALPPPFEINGPWDVQFQESRGAPGHVTFDKLISWSDHSDPGVKYFSGHATYSKTIQVPSNLTANNQRLYLDLGNVAVMANVTLNGKDLGTLWKRPFRVDVTDAIKPGDNQLQVRIVNLWINRQIGDEQLPEDSDRNPDGTLKSWPQWLQDDKPSPSGRIAFTTWRLWKKNDPLVESGLLGPVTLNVVSRVAVSK